MQAKPNVLYVDPKWSSLLTRVSETVKMNTLKKRLMVRFTGYGFDEFHEVVVPERGQGEAEGE